MSRVSPTDIVHSDFKQSVNEGWRHNKWYYLVSGDKSDHVVEVGPFKLLVLLFIFVMQIIYRRLGHNVLHLHQDDASLVFISSVENMFSVLMAHYHFITKHLFKLENITGLSFNKKKKHQTSGWWGNFVRDPGKTFSLVCVGGCVCFQNFYKLFCKIFSCKIQPKLASFSKRCIKSKAQFKVL